MRTWPLSRNRTYSKRKKIGHVILKTTEDKPWSQYFCCMAVARRDFVRRYPVATKRALRAILKASDICAREPERAARYLIDKGHVRIRLPIDEALQRGLAAISHDPVYVLVWIDTNVGSDAGDENMLAGAYRTDGD